MFYNLTEIGMDPQSFPDPERFDPERHLDPETKAFAPHPRVQPFGIGKRRCLGETLAKAELYMFFTGVVGRFKLEHESALATQMSDVNLIETRYKTQAKLNNCASPNSM